MKSKNFQVAKVQELIISVIKRGRSEFRQDGEKFKD